MTLNEFKSLLQQHPDKAFQFTLPSGDAVPVSFHITEVGRVQKSFIDCGGALHHTETCHLQAWVGADDDHRIASGKLAAILNKATPLLPNGDLPVEIEYEHEVLSQYPVERAEVTAGAVILHLISKHTDCLAKELCGVPASAPAASGCGCGPGCC